MEQQDICFVINLYHEPLQQIDILSHRLYELYPTASQLFISDGETAVTYGNSTFEFRDRLKVPGSVGKWILRYFFVFLNNSSAKYLIKIDSDTDPIQKIKVPLAGDVACAKLPLVTVDKDAFHPHAGVICFSRAYIERIVAGKCALNSAEYNMLFLGDREELVLRQLFKQSRAIVIDRPDFCCGTTRNKAFNPNNTSFWHY